MSIELSSLLTYALIAVVTWIIGKMAAKPVVPNPATPSQPAPTLGHGLIIKLLQDAIAKAEPAIKPLLAEVLQQFMAQLLQNIHLPPLQPPAPPK